MKTLLPFLAAAVLVVSPAAGAHAATNTQTRAFLDDAAASADARLANAGVNLAGARLKVRASFDADGRVNHLTVAESSGSLDVDAAVKAALKALEVGYVPPTLAGRNVILTLGAPAIVQAKAR